MPVGTVMMQSNHRPTVGADKGFWRRILLIPFVVQILGGDRDLELEDKFDAEIKGILAWAVRGAMEWCEKRLSPPAKVLLATEAYEDDMDYMSEFFLERCEISETAECLEDDLYKDFSDWAVRKGFPALKRRAFREELNRNGYKRVSALKAFKWLGIGLSAPRANK
jgi:putative DNA primase/helicase